MDGEGLDGVAVGFVDVLEGGDLVGHEVVLVWHDVALGLHICEYSIRE
jgi:hypothetical protein